MKISKNVFLEKFIIIITMLIVMYLWLSKNYLSNLVAFFVLAIDVYSVIKSKNNIFAFFVFLAITYFDYSVIFSKYFFRLPGYDWIFHYIKYDDTLFIGIMCLFFFHAIVLLLVKPDFYKNKDEIFNMNKNESELNEGKVNVLILLLILIVAFVLLDCLIFHMIFSMNTIYEYLIIPIIILIFLCRNKPVYRKILLLLIIISAGLNIYQGDRVMSISPLIAYFFINYYKKFNYKNVLIVMIIGIMTYTIFGMYGDLIVQKKDISDFKLSNYNNKMISNLFTLDTSYSSYWTSLTAIEYTNVASFKERTSNFIEFLTSYTLFGSKSNYVVVPNITRTYYPHWYGGFIMIYFYYWLGFIGVVLISIYISFLMNLFGSIKKSSSNFPKILFVYFICTMPRWYLYYPTSLIRGVLLLMIVYFVISHFLINKNNI